LPVVGAYLLAHQTTDAGLPSILPTLADHRLGPVFPLLIFVDSAEWLPCEEQPNNTNVGEREIAEQ
jgi:hypothetical protein